MTEVTINSSPDFWPTPNNCRRVADALDAITPARYGDILRAYADAEDARFALVSSAPAPASEGASDYQPCGHECNGCPTCDPGLAGVTSSDGDRGLSECACHIYPDAGQTCVTAGPKVIAAEGLCGPCSTRILAARTAPPEGVEGVEWGVLGGPGRQTSRVETHCMDPGGVHRQYDESLARYDTRDRPGDLFRRIVTEYAPVVGPWIEVTDAQ